MTASDARSGAMGVGGTVPTEIPGLAAGTETDRQTDCLSLSTGNSSVPQQLGTLDDALLAVGVFVGSRERRLQLVAQIEGRLSIEQVLTIGRHIAGSYRDRADIASATTARIMQDDRRCREVLEDIARAERLRPIVRPAPAEPQKKWHPGEGDRARTARLIADQRREWGAADREHWIRCRMRDGATREVAEAEYKQVHR